MIKNLCIIATSTQSISAFLEKYIEEFSKDNNKITLISNFSKNQKDYVNLEFLNKYKNLKKYHIPFSRKPNLVLDIISLFKLILFFRLNNFDLFFSITPKAGFISSIAGFFSKIRVRVHIFTGQVWYTQKGIVRFILKNFDKLIAYLNTDCLADSFTQKQFLIKENVFKSFDNKLKVIGQGSICGVDTNLFCKVNNKKKNDLKKKFGIDSESKIILFLGRLNKDKGVFDLGDAFDLIKNDYNKKLVLIFVGFDEQNCRDIIKKKSNYKNDIYFFDYIDNPSELLQIADIYCLPSYREGFGLSALEAGACNLPSVTSNTIGLTDVIIENKTGLLHDPGDILKIKENILTFLNDENLCKKFGENARKRILENFDSQKIVKSYVDYLKNLYEYDNFALIGTSANSIYNFRGSFIEFLKKNSFKIYAFAGKPKTNDRKKIENLKISYTDYSVSNARFNILKELYVIIKLFFKLYKKKPKIIFTYTLKAVIFFGLFKFFGFFKNVKSIAFITGVGNAFIDYNRSISSRLVFYICRFLYKISLKNYDKVLFQNNDDVNLFEQLSILKNQKSISIIPSSGVEINHFKNNKSLYPDNITFGLASRMIINKGILEFCAAAKKIKKKFPNVNFKIVGDFEKSIYSLEYSKTINLFKNSEVEYSGWEDDINNFYKNISVYVLPSYREGTPRSVLEAMASARAIITTNVPGCKETVIQNKNGFLIKEKNVDELEKSMIKFIEDRNLIQLMGLKSFDIACEKFDVEIINKKLLDEIKNVVNL